MRRARIRANPLGFAHTHEMQVVSLLVIVEIAFLFYATYRGVGDAFLKRSFVLIPLSVISYLISVRMEGDKYLVLINTILLNMGFLVQILTGETNEKHVIAKCLAAYVAAYLVGIIYYYLAEKMSSDVFIYVFLFVQVLLILLLKFFGYVVESESDQGAIVSVYISGFSFQPLELVKIIYIFVLATLLCKEECEKRTLLGMPRNLFLLMYTAFLAVWMIRFSEYGSLIIMIICAGIMMFIYTPGRILVWGLGGTAVFLGADCWRTLEFVKPEAGGIGKIYKRLKYFLHPELDYAGSGYQGVLARKALTVGEFFGPDSERYLFDIPMESNDMVFAKLVQSCGLVMGVLVILTVVLLVQRGITISRNCKDPYFSGLAMALTLMMGVQSLYHIAYNCGFAPIAGLPLYMVSEGFTSTSMGMAMMGILMTLSTNRVKRREQNEKEMYENYQRFFHRIGLLLWPVRKRPHRESSLTK